jgi:plasmid segregation protein ParM
VEQRNSSAHRAIDVGYGFTKFTTAETRQLEGGVLTVPTDQFSSVPFHKPTTMGGMGLGAGPRTIDVKLAGVNYCVSDDPAAIAPDDATRGEGERYTESMQYDVCMAAAVKTMGVESLDVLVLGTPVGNYLAAKTQLQRRYSNGIRFDDRDVPIGSLRVVPQPIGGLAWHYASRRRAGDIGKVNRLLVDVGFGTLDWVVAQGLVPNPSKSGTTGGGVSKYIRAVVSQMKHGQAGIAQSLALTEMVDKMLTQNTGVSYRRHRYERDDFKDMLDAIAMESAQQIFSTLGDVGVIESVVLMGGGATLMQSAIAKVLRPVHVELIAESRLANVKGFQLIAEMSEVGRG